MYKINIEGEFISRNILATRRAVSQYLNPIVKPSIFKGHVT